MLLYNHSQHLPHQAQNSNGWVVPIPIIQSSSLPGVKFPPERAVPHFRLSSPDYNTIKYLSK